MPLPTPQFIQGRAPAMILLTTRSLRALLLAGVALLSLAMTGGAVAADKRLAQDAAADADGFIATRAKKPGSGVTLAYRVEGAVSAKVPTEVTLRFGSVTSPDGATVAVAGTDGLVLAETTSAKLTAHAAQQELRVRVTAPADGVYYLNVTTRQGGRAHVTSVPITVGKGKVKLQKNGSVQTMPNGERVVSLPSR